MLWNWLMQIFQSNGFEATTKENRQLKRDSGTKFGFIYFSHSTSVERYYLWILLNVVLNQITSYEDIRTVNDIAYPTFREACYPLELLIDDKEWNDCIVEALGWTTSSQLWRLFASILLYCPALKPGVLSNKNWELLCEDIQYMQRRLAKCQTMDLTDEHKKNFALLDITNAKTGREVIGTFLRYRVDGNLLRTMSNTLIM